MVKRISAPWRESDDFLDFSLFLDPQGEPGALTAGISLAAAGSLNPFKIPGRKARNRFFSQRGFSGISVGYCRQIHSRKVLVLDRMVLKGFRADGLVTRRKNTLLTVTAADCMPIFLYDRETGSLGLCHSGWKGTGIASEAVLKMEKRFGARRESMTALLGPAIGSCCYKVDSARAGIFKAQWGADAVIQREGSWFLDMKTANLQLLESMGLGTVLSLDACTVCDDRLGSFRRQGPENYTRMTAFLGFSPAY